MSTRRDKAKAGNQLQHQLAVQQQQRQQAEQRANQREANKKVAGKMGDFSLDVAKLIVGGVILAGLMQQDVSYWILFGLGFTAVILFIVFGMILIHFSHRK